MTMPYTLTFATGDIPFESLISKRNNIDDLGFDVSNILWSGCIDAPGFIPAGSTAVKDIPSYIDRN